MVLSAGTASAKSDAPKLTREQVEEAIPFELNEFKQAEQTLPKKLGAQKTSSARAQIWYYEPEKTKGSTNVSCKSIAVVKTPYGHAVLEESVMNGDPCVATKLTKKMIDAVRPAEKQEFAGTEMVTTRSYDDTVKAFVAKLGKAAQTTEMFDQYKMLAYRYLDGEGGACKYVTLISQGDSDIAGFHKVWNLDCK
jgi:hypothetical protein